MARTIDQIQTQINTELVANFALIGVIINPSTWSKRNIIRLFAYSFAVCISYVEQMMDSMKTSIEITVAKSAAASSQWIQNQMFLFQFSSTDPQVIQLINTQWAYPVIDATKRIITACSVSSPSANNVIVKVAKSSPFEALNVQEIAAAQGFINLIGTEGIVYTIKSLNADKIYISADIYFKGQYSSTIETDVISAINNYLEQLSTNNFSGEILVTDIETAMRSALGVTDVLLKDVYGRVDTDAFGFGSTLVANKTTIQRKYASTAGYAVGELSPNDFANTLTFIAE